MTSERAQAYGRVMKTLDDLSPSKLHPEQQEVVREAADGLLFSEDVSVDPAARESLERLHALGEQLVENDTLLPETVGRLLADVEACGPVAPVC